MSDNNYELTYSTEYKNEEFPFLNVTDENKRFCPIFKEIYTDKDFPQLELLYFEVNKENKNINFQIGIVTNSDDENVTDNVTNVVWQFGLPYSNEHFLVAHGNRGTMGYVVIDMDAALKLDKTLWPNFTWVEIEDSVKQTKVKKQHFISRPEYLLDHSVIAEVNDSPRIKNVILNNSCRYVNNYNIDANIVELYIERQGSWGKLSVVQKKEDKGNYTKSYISPEELNLFIKEDDNNTIYQLYATNTNDPQLGFVVVRGSMPSANLQPNTIYLITSAINLNGKTLTLGQGTCLQFRGGTISNGTIMGQGSLIDAPECRIFQDKITLVGEFSNQFPIEWWGALPSAKFDSAAAINAATASGAKNIVAHGENYYVKSTVFIEKEHISFTFDGNLNGNVFHSIGFEGLQYPIHNLWLWTSNRFYDLRMSESIEGKVFISMAFCEDLLFTFKSNITDYIQLTEVDEETGSVKYTDFFYFDKIQTDNQCKNIVVKEQSFTLMYSNTENKLIPFQNTDIVDFLKANVKPSFSF